MDQPDSAAAPDTHHAPAMRQAIRLPHATALVVGTIVGAAIFTNPAEVTGAIPTVLGSLAVWVCAGALSLIGALACAELASRFTQSGGVYIYLREAFGEVPAFLWGWSLFWVVHSGILAAIAMVFARYAGYIVPMDEVEQKIAAVAVIWLLSIINFIGVRHGSVLQTLFTAGKLLAIALMIVIGLTLGGRVEEHFVEPADAPAFAAGDFLIAMIAGLFAFGGWHMVTYNSEETVNPRRTIPRALLIGTIVVTASYLLLNATYLYVLPLEQVAASDRIAADAAEAVLGHNAGQAMAGLVMFSTFGALAGIVLAGPRVYLAMARDELVFQWFASIHGTFRTPHVAILAQAIWASVLVGTGTFRVLFTRVIYTEWIFFALMTIGLLLLRRRLGRAEYTMLGGWGGPLLPVIFIGFSLLIVINHVFREPEESATGLSIVLTGVPVYVVWTMFARRRPGP